MENNMYHTGPITVSFPLGLFGSASMSMGSAVEPDQAPLPLPKPIDLPTVPPELDESDVYWDEEGV
jgi:hypothetical protein